jgi:hypothetical protein
MRFLAIKQSNGGHAWRGEGVKTLDPRPRGPGGSFVRKISKLNRESPLMKSTSLWIAPNADRVPNVAKLNRFESLCAVLTRPTGGGGGFKSLAHWGAATAALLTRRIFFPPKRLKKFCLIKFFKRLGRKRRSTGARKKSFWPAPELQRRASEKTPRNSGWGG